MSYKKRVDLFIECVYKYVKMFNLGNYDIEILGTNDKDVYGQCRWFRYEDGTKSANIYFSKPWLQRTKNVTVHEIKKAAFHEVCELLLAELNQIAHERFIEEREIIKSVHEIIGRLEFLATEKGFL